MPPSKTDFIKRIQSLSKSITIDAVTQKSNAEKEHNSIATLLRNGLAVVGFAALEDYIKKRSSEAMGEIGNSPVAFSQLPEKLQKAFTYDAISALNYQLSLRGKHEKIPYIQEHTKKISSTATSSYEISPHAFGYNKANVSEETIKTILSSFNIPDPWGQMTSISSRLNITALPLSESYRNAYLRRHKAAHVAAAVTPQIDISQFVKEAFAIAITFDTLLSKAISKIHENDTNYLRGYSNIDGSKIIIRTIRKIDNKWKENLEGKTRAYRVSTDKETLKPLTKIRSQAAKNLYVEFNTNGTIEDWEAF